ncbi:MAG: DUF2283 domain-containing protein [Calditrichae bacterium]|nr:DUF2283 domain-containing protein [Calditrichia bacterium]
MASINPKDIIKLTPQILKLPSKNLWSNYDEEADVLYINFKKPSHADDSELTDDNLIIRYEKGEVVGITILNASKRKITTS